MSGGTKQRTGGPTPRDDYRSVLTRLVDEGIAAGVSMAAGAFVYVTANLERHGNAQLAPTYAGPASLARALGVHVRTIKRWKAAAKVLELVDVENHRHPDCDRWNLTSRLHYRFRPGSRGAELLAALLDARDLARQRSRAGLKAPRTEPPPEPPAVSWVECPACSNVYTGPPCPCLGP